MKNARPTPPATQRARRHAKSHGAHQRTERNAKRRRLQANLTDKSVQEGQEQPCETLQAMRNRTGKPAMKAGSQKATTTLSRISSHAANPTRGGRPGTKKPGTSTWLRHRGQLKKSPDTQNLAHYGGEGAPVTDMGLDATVRSARGASLRGVRHGRSLRQRRRTRNTGNGNRLRA